VSRWFLLLLGACWTSEPPRSPTAAPARQPAVTPRAPVSAKPERDADQRDDPALAAQLRVSGARDLTAWVVDPLVVLDVDAGTFSTVCGSAAQLAAWSFGARLADPARPEPRCAIHVPTQRRTCWQMEPPPITTTPHDEVLIVELGTTASPRLVTAVTGHISSRNMGLANQLDRYAASATCP
jgi:hypothetical protein